MKKVHVIHGIKHNVNTRAFIFPLWVYRNALRNAGIELRFFQEISSRAIDADSIFLDSKVLKPMWSNRYEEAVQKLAFINSRCDALYWFNTSDSSGLIQSQVLPFVKKYLKSHLLKDKHLYCNAFYGGRIFSDFYFRKGVLQGSEESCSQGLDVAEIRKLAVSWNLGMANIFTENAARASAVERLTGLYLIRKYPRQSWKRSLHLHGWEKRDNFISARLSTNYDRESVRYQRETTQKHLQKYGVSTGRLSTKEYFTELRSSRFSISPFGWGEVNIRDFESMLAGACLLKPSMKPFETYPSVFEEGSTYISFQWDFSDFHEMVESLKHVDGQEMSNNAVSRYLDHFGQEGARRFVERVSEILS